jgi:phage repressor protein C with HTH and peptisase S24 domain
MAKKKAAKTKKVSARKKPQPKTKIAAKKKLAPKRKKVAARKKPARRKARRPSGGKQEITNPVAIRGQRGLGSASGGQSGDTQGLSRREDVDSESVTELAEEGQDYEAGVVSGVENARDPDEGEVTTTEVPEDDVPPEYTDRNQI